MNEEIKTIWKSFYDWVIGNGPGPENEVIPDEPHPDLLFTQRPKDKYSRFHEATLKGRYNQWLRSVTSIMEKASVIASMINTKGDIHA